MRFAFLIVFVIGCGAPAIQPEVTTTPYVYVEPTPPAPVVQYPPQVQAPQPIPEDHPCWDAVKERASDWVDVGRDWIHDATLPDCKSNPDARGCK